MKTLLPENLYYLHNILSIIMLLMCMFIAYCGYKIKNQQYKKNISYGLIFFACSQEILDYLNRFFFDELYMISLSVDLPLQFCSLGFYFSLFGIIMAVSSHKFNVKFEQFIFDCTYVLGFGGALQALITVDLTGINNMIGIFALHLGHSLIMLNVVWLIFAFNKRFNIKSIFNAFLFINIIIIPIGGINYLLSANYMFVCQPPNVQSSFFIGQWPYYLLYLELIYFIYILILYLPFALLNRLNVK